MEITDNEETFKILYNSCHGGWGISNKTIELYNSKMKQIDDSFIPLTKYDKHKITRDDTILIEIFEQYPDDFGGHFSKISMEVLPKKFKNYYYISEYDGNETIHINIDKYNYDILKNKIKEILLKNIKNDDKIIELTNVCETSEYKYIYED